jgi:hypothetical protein
MAVKLSALRSGRPLPPGSFLVLTSVRGWVDHKAIVRLEGLGQLNNSVTSSGIEPATFRLVTVPQPTTLPRTPRWNESVVKTERCCACRTESDRRTENAEYWRLDLKKKKKKTTTAVCSAELLLVHCVLMWGTGEDVSIEATFWAGTK